jgi:hypothetical protein
LELVPETQHLLAKMGGSPNGGGLIKKRIKNMCTMISQQTSIKGSGKAAGEWFTLGQVYVSYDHPYHAPWEHALNIDFVNEAQGSGARVAVELDAASARRLMETIQSVLAQAERGGFVEEVR